MSANSGRAMAIFTEAVKRPSAERSAFLDQACEGDADLRRKVEALIDAYERLGDFLETPPPKPGSTVISDPETDGKPPRPNSNNGNSNSK